MARTPTLPPRDQITDDAPLRLEIAAALAYPDGSMTASGLRKEARRGRLVVERTAGKDYTTLRNIEHMRELCRVEAGARVFGWFCPRPRRRASGGSLAKRRHGCCGPPGTTVRYRRASRRADARGNISRGLFCLRFTLARALVPSAERHCNLPSVAVGSTSRAACSIAGPRASARRKSESRQSPYRRNCTGICGAGNVMGSGLPSNGLASRCHRSKRRSALWPRTLGWAQMLRHMYCGTRRRHG